MVSLSLGENCKEKAIQAKEGGVVWGRGKGGEGLAIWQRRGQWIGQGLGQGAG